MANNILIFTHEPIRREIGGLGIRHYELSNVLARYFSVTLITPHETTLNPASFKLRHIPFSDIETIKEEIDKTDVMVINDLPWFLLDEIERSKKPVVIDLMPSFHFEDLERISYDKKDLEEDAPFFINHIKNIKKKIEIGDFFITPTERERDYYLGVLTVEGKLYFPRYKDDKNFRNIINTVPFGIPSEPPRKTASILRTIEGITDNDFIIIWSGAIWNWYDFETLLYAIKKASSLHPDIKLVFVGTHHPASTEQHSVYNKLLKVAKELGLMGKNIFVKEGWVPYHERQNYLLEADIGVVTSLDHIENHFSYRIRLTDYIWASLPFIITPGNVFSELAKEEAIGCVVDFQNPDALASAIIKMYEDIGFRNRCKGNLDRIRGSFFWESVAEPLVRFCSLPSNLKPLPLKLFTNIPVDIINYIKPERILFLRSSPIAHSFKALEAICNLFPEASVDAVIQYPVLDRFANIFSEEMNVRIIPYNANRFDPKTADIYYKEAGLDREYYDIAVCAMSNIDLVYYKNVIQSLLRLKAKFYWAVNHDGFLLDIRSLFR